MCSQSQLVEDGVDSLLDRAFTGYGNAGFTLGIVLIDSVVMGNNAQQAHTVLVDLLADHVADLAAGSAVDDEAHLTGAQLQIHDHVNEAGLEHLSRGVLPKVDTIILVSDCSRRGVQAAGRIFELTKSLNLGAKEVKLLINRAPGGVANAGVLEEVEKFGMDLLGVLPQDDEIYEYDGEGRPTAELPEDNAFKKALYEALDKMNF